MKWSAVQGHIVTGGGELVACTAEGRDFHKEELPHYHLQMRSTRKQFEAWLQDPRCKSDLLCGCWSRPVFAGGWLHDSESMTEAFNLQTPSLFIDMRFPVDRPTEHLRQAGSVEACTDEELMQLAQQHCFAGYSLPSEGVQGGLDADKPHFTRHHIIDWNFHPRFPRPRPNKWWVQVSPDGQSFKEFSFARNALSLPVYFEQWRRREGDSGGLKYLAARREVGCPIEAAEQGREPESDGLFIIMGNHFAFAKDRAQPVPDFSFASVSGPAGPALVDQTLADRSADSQGWERRRACELYLSLEGSYGLVHCPSSSSSSPATFVVSRSTMPWREGQRVLPGDGAVTFLGHSAHGQEAERGELFWAGLRFRILECSFARQELLALFPSSSTSLSLTPSAAVKSHL